MGPSTKKRIAPLDLPQNTSVTPEEKQRLKSVSLEQPLEFFQGEVNIHIANRFDRRQNAYRLLYDLYSKMGIAEKNGDGLWLSLHDALPETITFIAENGRGEVDGALTMVFDSVIGLPADDLYKKEIDAIRHSGETVSEIISLGINSEGKASIKLLACLFYCAFLHSWHREKTSAVVITVHADYEDFYNRRVCFNKLGPVRKYTKVNEEPTVLLGVSLNELDRLRRQKRVFPFYMLPHSLQEEIYFTEFFKSKNLPMSDEEFFSFFIDKTDIWEKATPHQKDFIKGIYPENNINDWEAASAWVEEYSKNKRSTADMQGNTTKVVGR